MGTCLVDGGKHGQLLARGSDAARSSSIFFLLTAAILLVMYQYRYDKKIVDEPRLPHAVPACLISLGGLIIAGITVHFWDPAVHLLHVLGRQRSLDAHTASATRRTSFSASRWRRKSRAPLKSSAQLVCRSTFSIWIAKAAPSRICPQRQSNTPGDIYERDPVKVAVVNSRSFAFRMRQRRFTVSQKSN